MQEKVPSIVFWQLDIISKQKTVSDLYSIRCNTVQFLVQFSGERFKLGIKRVIDKKSYMGQYEKLSLKYQNTEKQNYLNLQNICSIFLIF